MVILGICIGTFVVLLVVILLLIRRHKNKFKPHFRKFHDSETQGHPQYVYGKNRKNYKTIGITHGETTDNVKNIPMERNPEPGKTKQSFMLPRPNRIPKKTRNRKLPGWTLTKKDEKKAKKIARRRPRRKK